jgi:hypothetical protein
VARAHIKGRRVAARWRRLPVYKAVSRWSKTGLLPRLLVSRNFALQISEDAIAQSEFAGRHANYAGATMPPGGTIP